MGWSSGTPLFATILEVVQENVTNPDIRKKIYLPILSAFEDADWNNVEECLDIDPVFDEIYQDMYPDDDAGWRYDHDDED